MKKKFNKKQGKKIRNILKEKKIIGKEISYRYIKHCFIMRIHSVIIKNILFENDDG